MSLPDHAVATPGKPAIILAETGEYLTFAQLNDLSMRLARILRRHLQPGARVALLQENSPAVFVAAWACRRAELRYVPVNWHLTTDEAAYIVSNSDAQILIASPALSAMATSVAEQVPELSLLLSDGAAFGAFTAMQDAILAEPSLPFGEEREGASMFYSSGTTGRPKGILRPLANLPFGTPSSFENRLRDGFGFDADSVFYTPAPLYHAAPMGWCIGTQILGGTAVITRRFDAENVLAHIEKYRISHAQFVPTHFVRMLKLPEETRNRYRHDSLRMVIHAAAPCPIDVKEQMMAWFGPIIHEFYGTSEGNGFTMVRPDEWLAHKGTVGKCVTGPVLVVDDDGSPLPVGDTGHLLFSATERFDYHKDPAKTAEYFTGTGWARSGDMGWMDAEGYIYLADRSSNMIISGGVNIYPQEAEAVLALHPAIADVAVIGVPDAEMGEAVKAVVELAPGHTASAALAEDIIAYARSRLAHFKCPRSIDFIDSIPRLPTGKLLKRELRKSYWGDGRSQLVQ